MGSARALDLFQPAVRAWFSGAFPAPTKRDIPETPRTAVLTATDPANPYGAIVKWPDVRSSASPARVTGRGPTRSVGARVILVDGFLAGYLRRGERELLLHLAVSREEGRRRMLLSEINGEAAVSHAASRVFIEEGFIPTAMGLQARLRPGALALVRT